MFFWGSLYSLDNVLLTGSYGTSRISSKVYCVFQCGLICGTLPLQFLGSIEFLFVWLVGCWFFGWLVGFGFKDIVGSKDTRVGRNPCPDASV